MNGPRNNITKAMKGEESHGDMTKPNVILCSMLERDIDKTEENGASRDWKKQKHHTQQSNHPETQTRYLQQKHTEDTP